jgi:hypothetical protein
VVGRDEADAVANFHHLPAALMYEPMVIKAKGKKVGQVARSASAVELDVMRIGPVDRPVATRSSTAAVAGFQGSVLGRRDGSRRPTHIDHL